MQGYKATKNMKCETLTYEVGKEYEIDDFKICSHGFHFCKNMKDVLNYYIHDETFVLLEVEALGEIVNSDDKSVTNKLKVIRIIPPDEYTFPFNAYEYDDRNNKISETRPNGEKSTWEYDNKGNVIKYNNGITKWSITIRRDHY